MEYKKFTDIKKDDNLYFFIDKYGVIVGNNASNPNYGVIITSSKVTEFNNFFFPRKDEGKLLEFHIAKPIEEVHKSMYIYNSWVNGVRVPETIPEHRETLFSYANVTKKEGGESHIIRKYNNYGSHYFDIHIFTTKEELEAFIKEELKTIEGNIKKTYNALNKLK